MTTPYDQDGHALDPPDELMQPSAGDWRVETDLAMTAAHMILVDGRLRFLNLGDFDRMARVLFHQRQEIAKLSKLLMRATCLALDAADVVEADDEEEGQDFIENIMESGGLSIPSRRTP
jgi:predicted metal-dependent RNase